MIKKAARTACGIIAAACCVLSSASMSGCSDFSFNPIGNWKLSSDKIYCDGRFFSDEKPGYLKMDSGDPDNPSFIYMGDLIYHFTKSGTGTVTVEDGKESVKTMDFTYEYTDHSVTMNIKDIAAQKNNYDSIQVTYEVVKDKNGNTILRNQDKFNANDTSGKSHKFNEVRLLYRH